MAKTAQNRKKTMEELRSLSRKAMEDRMTEIIEDDIVETLRRFAVGKKPEPKPEPKDAEIQILDDIIIRPLAGGFAFFWKVPGEYAGRRAVAMLAPLVKSLDACRTEEKDIFRDHLIKILEEKFGLKIKICAHCINRISCYGGSFRGNCDQRLPNKPCTRWASKEIPEEKNN